MQMQLNMASNGRYKLVTLIGKGYSTHSNCVALCLEDLLVQLYSSKE